MVSDSNVSCFFSEGGGGEGRGGRGKVHTVETGVLVGSIGRYFSTQIIKATLFLISVNVFSLKKTNWGH